MHIERSAITWLFSYSGSLAYDFTHCFIYL